jgi:hypothetical protein
MFRERGFGPKALVSRKQEALVADENPKQLPQ